MQKNIDWDESFSQVLNRLNRIKDSTNYNPNFQIKNALRKMFDEGNASLLTRIKESESREAELAENLQATKDEWESRGFLSKAFSSKPDFPPLERGLKQAQDATSKLKQQEHQEWENYQNNSLALERAEQSHQKNDIARKQQECCNAFCERVKDIRKASQQKHFIPPNGLLDNISTQTSDSDFFSLLEKNMEQIEHYIKHTQPHELAIIFAAEATEKILRNPVSFGKDKDGEVFESYRLRNLSELNSITKFNDSASLQDAIQSLRNPDYWQHVNQWLVFWTAMAASQTLVRDGTPSETEPTLCQKWVEAWKTQTANWPSDMKSFFKIDPAFVYSSMQNGNGEKESGADAMLALCFYSNSSYTIQLVYIQFKRAPTDTRISQLKIIHDKKYDQYCRLLNWHRPDIGSNAMYGMLSPQLGVIEIASAITVDTVKKVINRTAGRNEASSHESWGESEGAIPWKDNAGSMPVMLAKVARETNGFASLDDVIKWINETISDTSVQPDFWVVQAIGEPSITIEKHIDDPQSEFYAPLKGVLERLGYTQQAVREHTNNLGMNR